MARALFSMGSLYITPGARTARTSPHIPPDLLFIRHAGGNWSEMTKEDQAANRQAITHGTRIFSAYQFGDVHFFVITEADWI